MRPDQQERVQALVAAALAHRDVEARSSFLEQSCPDDSAVRAEADRLIAEYEHLHTTGLGSIPRAYAAAATGAAVESTLTRSVGSSFGPYQIEAQLGVGGMGEVFRACDIRLRRSVAIKFSNRRFSPQLQREAHAIAHLNHPNICTLHDIGPDYLIMEWINGRTLKDVIADGPMEFDQILTIAVQLARGLAAAHSRGIFHRDIKPSNVMLTEDGLIKITDFGLAKYSASMEGSDDTGADSLTNSGAFMGTPSYMSPEQASGRPVDHRSDIWSFGVVLYEMATGQKPFQASAAPTGDVAKSKLRTRTVGGGQSMTALAILRAIIDDDPQPVDAFRKDLPPEFTEIIEKALSKDPSARYERMDYMLADLLRLRGSSETSDAQSAGFLGGIGSASTRRRPLPLRYWLSGAVALLLLAGAALYRSRSRLYYTGTPSGGVVALTSYWGSEDYASFSPDGSQFAFTWDGRNQDNIDIYVKSVDGSSQLRLTTDPAPDVAPSWSPDGRWIAFIRGRGIYLVAPLGGPERRISTLNADALSWTPDGKWLAASAQESDGDTNSIYLISIDTGETRRLTTPSGSLGDRDPSFSPAGRKLAFVRWGLPAGCGLYICDFVENSCRNVRALTRDSEIYGITWTPDSREIVFSANRYGMQSLWRIPADASDQASIVNGLPGNVRRPAISRPGSGARGLSSTRLAYTQTMIDFNIWRLDLEGSPSTRGRSGAPLITSTRMDISPQYSPDGHRIAFVSDRSGNKEIWACNSDGSNPQQLTFFSQNFENSSSGPPALFADGSPRWSPDGSRIAFHVTAGGQRRIYTIGARGDSMRRASPEAFDAWGPAWSADGRWIYFSSNRAGSLNLWKAPLEGPEDAIQVTRGAGFDPAESPDGKSLYFLSDGRRLPDEIPLNGSTLIRMPVNGGSEAPVLQGVQPGRWTISDRGIFFLDVRSEPAGHPGARAVKFLSFATRKVEQIGLVEKKSLSSWNTPSYVGGLSVSPDHRWMLWTFLDRAESDVMLVNNFR